LSFHKDFIKMNLQEMGCGRKWTGFMK